MPTSDALLNILHIAIQAPSGDNSQPWEFEILPNEIRIYNKPDSDPTLYNFKQRGSYMAHGAVVENIVLLARQAGYTALVEPFPPIPTCSAAIRFEPTVPVDNPLCDAIPKRSTNRKPYKKTALTQEHRSALVDAIESHVDVGLQLIEEKTAMQVLAKEFGFNEQLLMENRPLHDFLFSIIRWSKAEEAQHPGLFVDTMELPPPVRFMFRHVLCRWWLLRILNLFGLSKIISMQTSAIYESSGAFGILTVPSDDDVQFFEAGRAFQKLWLTATDLGLSLQPVTALAYLAQRAGAGEAQDFSVAHVLRIQAAEKIIRAHLDTSECTMAMIFRIGYGDPPSASSTKQKPLVRTILS